MDQPIPNLHTAPGAHQVDTDPACSSCGGDCPCPQACERREDAPPARKPVTGSWVALFKWGRA
jgi:hypothetical protein